MSCKGSHYRLVIHGCCLVFQVPGIGDVVQNSKTQNAKSECLRGPKSVLWLQGLGFHLILDLELSIHGLKAEALVSLLLPLRVY